MKKTGRILIVAELAKEYGFKDVGGMWTLRIGKKFLIKKPQLLVCKTCFDILMSSSVVNAILTVVHLNLYEIRKKFQNRYHIAVCLYSDRSQI